MQQLHRAVYSPVWTNWLLAHSLQIDAPWAPTPVGKFIAARIGVYEKLAPFFIRLFDDPGREVRRRKTCRFFCVSVPCTHFPLISGGGVHAADAPLLLIRALLPALSHSGQLAPITPCSRGLQGLSRSRRSSKQQFIRSTSLPHLRRKLQRGQRLSWRWISTRWCRVTQRRQSKMARPPLQRRFLPQPHGSKPGGSTQPPAAEARTTD